MLPTWGGGCPKEMEPMLVMRLGPLGLEGGDADLCAKLWGEAGQTWRVSRMQDPCVSQMMGGHVPV